jgi:hypothetical protein
VSGSVRSEDVVDDIERRRCRECSESIEATWKTESLLWPTRSGQTGFRTQPPSLLLDLLSVVKTAYSDLDLVVIYDQLACAYRESFRFDRYPVEAFVHDPETLEYFFFEVDRPSGVPALPQMVVEGIEIPAPNEISRALKQQAASLIAMGPPVLNADSERKWRYAVTDLLDDLRDARSVEEWSAPVRV